jgi:hypothetical protein
MIPTLGEAGHRCAGPRVAAGPGRHRTGRARQVGADRDRGRGAQRRAVHDGSLNARRRDCPGNSAVPRVNHRSQGERDIQWSAAARSTPTRLATIADCPLSGGGIRKIALTDRGAA